MTQPSALTCSNPALFRYTWPGRDEAFACYTHAAQLRAVADALGMHLQLIALTADQRQHTTCQSFIATQ